MQLAKQKNGFKQTEVGLIPADWDVTTVGDEFSIQLGKMLDSEKNIGVAKPFLGNRAVQWGRFDITDIGTIKLTPSDLSRFRLHHGDLLVCEGGEIGRAAIWDSSIEECYFQKALHRLRPKRKYSVKLMLNVLHRLASTGFLLNFVTQTSIAHLPKDKFETVPIPLPPTLAEQEAIASALSDADGLIESLEKLIVKKRQIKHGTMQELLTGQRRLPGFSGKWQTKRFDEVFSNLRNASNSRSELAPHGEVAYVHYGDIHIHQTAFLNPLALQTFIPRAKVRAVPRLMDGDLLMADASEDTTAIGKAVEITGLNGADAVAGLHTMALRGNKEFLADGFKGYIQFMPNVRNALVSLATGVSVYGITKSGVKAIEITIPKPAEQSAIATLLSDLDAEIAGLEAKLAKARQIKQGMMQELLTGRIRLV